MDYLKDVQIDPTALDVEILGQAELAMKWGVYYADCKEAANKAEEEIKVIRSELTAAALEDPTTCLGEGVKATGPAVEAYYRMNTAHKAAKKKWLTAQHDLDIADVAKWQIGTTRKDMLESLVKLHSSAYFAGPDVPRDLSKEALLLADKKAKDVRMHKKLSRKK